MTKYKVKMISEGKEIFCEDIVAWYLQINAAGSIMFLDQARSVIALYPACMTVVKQIK